MSTLVVGVGNRWRGDDAVGLVVAALVRAASAPGVRVVEHEGDCTRLVELLCGERDVVIVDAAAPAGAPGELHSLDAAARPISSPLLRSSTHAFGVADAIELARALGRLPERLRVYAIEGGAFAAGSRLSPEVEHAAQRLAAQIAACRASRGLGSSE